MLIETIIKPTPETTKKLFDRPLALINFRAAVRRATDNVEREVESGAPKATGEYLRSISSTIYEYDDPYRIVSRCYSTHDAADIIEFGAAPHMVPTRAIMRWMQAVGIRVSQKITPLEVAFRIQRKIAENGLKPKHVFTRAYGVAEQYFHSAIDPILSALDGSATYDIELRSSGSYVPRYDSFLPD